MFNFWFKLPLRVRLGVMATVVLVAAIVVVFFVWRDPVHHPVRQYGFLIKIAPILFLLWLAWQDLAKIPLWVYLITPPILIICFLKPILFLIVIPVAFIAQLEVSRKR
ncbi:MAG: hypothetical protein LBQ66_04065 [Planctomycetaceae bacterium]|jgi:hypothetical protein|nr:hypothetical protein [Planctomycetaceae bacterium]